MENKTEESIIVTIDDTEGNSRDFVQDMAARPKGFERENFSSLCFVSPS